LIEAVPAEDALGPAVITLFLDEGPLPTNETVTRLIARLRLDEPDLQVSSVWHRNTCIVLGCLAEKLAGASSVHICTNTTLNYLLDNLKPDRHTEVIIYALIALEKFAQTSENRLTICRRLEKYMENPLMKSMLIHGKRAYYGVFWPFAGIILVRYSYLIRSFLHEVAVVEFKDVVDGNKREANFVTVRCIVCEKRDFSYRKRDVTNINAMLNHADVSEYLKIGSDGLEVSDALLSE
uniref:Uncharacterized protein n=1 Tax=Parascaris equorum TaxID=6256 RepID=A0A914R3N5_PAREQ